MKKNSIFGFNIGRKKSEYLSSSTCDPCYKETFLLVLCFPSFHSQYNFPELFLVEMRLTLWVLAIVNSIGVYLH